MTDQRYVSELTPDEIAEKIQRILEKLDQPRSKRSSRARTDELSPEDS